MKITFKNQLHLIKKCSNQFDHASNETRLACMQNFAAMALAATKDLITYTETLLFISAYPCEALQYSLAQKELKRIAAFLKRNKNTRQQIHFIIQACLLLQPSQDSRMMVSGGFYPILNAKQV